MQIPFFAPISLTKALVKYFSNATRYKDPSAGPVPMSVSGVRRAKAAHANNGH